MAFVRWVTEEMGNMLTAGNPIKREELMILNSWMIYRVTHAQEKEAGCYKCQLISQMKFPMEVLTPLLLKIRPRKVSVQKEKARERCCTLVKLASAPCFQNRVQNFCYMSLIKKINISSAAQVSLTLL